MTTLKHVVFDHCRIGEKQYKALETTDASGQRGGATRRTLILLNNEEGLEGINERIELSHLRKDGMSTSVVKKSRDLGQALRREVYIEGRHKSGLIFQPTGQIDGALSCGRLHIDTKNTRGVRIDEITDQIPGSRPVQR